MGATVAVTAMPRDLEVARAVVRAIGDDVPVLAMDATAPADVAGVADWVAGELGPRRVRANLVAAGPLETRAATAVPGFDLLLRSWEQRAPLVRDRRDPGPVADAVCFLLSDLARAITGEILQVDGGHHASA